MQRTWAIAMLTWKAAFRFRLFWVLTALLLGAVGLLPLLLKDDGTARGFVQLVLTYNLTIITILLGFATLWLACGTLARDIEECQMQLVAVKPIARWQIWLGKWLGILLLNAALLAIAGTSVYALLQWRAHQLPPDQYQILQREVFVARGSLKPAPPDLDRWTEDAFRQRLQEVPVPPAQHPQLRHELRQQLKAGAEVARAGGIKTWTVNLGLRQHLLKDQPLHLRAKFHVAVTNITGEYRGIWQAGVPGKTPVWRQFASLADSTYHEFTLPPNLFDENGVLTLQFANLSRTAMLFPLEDGFEILYREGGFALNYTRGLAVILCWMALLSAVGLASASLLSFPVAAFFSLSLLLVALSSGTLTAVVAEGTVTGVDHETGMAAGTWLDAVMVPFFHGLLSVISLVQAFSPVEALSAGRSITWGTLGRAFLQIILIMGGFFAALGITCFTRRELATAQDNS